MKIKKLLIALSLLASASATLADPIMMGYYSNWETYAPNNYPFNGNAQGAVNNDLGYKLARINTVAYDFLEVDSNGYVYFTDPYSDLIPSDSFCLNPPAGSPKDQGTLNNGLNLTCTEVANINKQAFSSAAGLGNFDKGFINSDVPTRMISIGGFGHDDAWENAMNNPTNFVNSVAALVKAYNLQGVDVDYEVVGGMPAANYTKFISLITQLRTALGPNVLITYAIPANAQAITNFDNGSSHNWTALMQQLSYVDVMGYDLHGEFDNPRLTGLHSALYAVPNDPTQFNDDAAIEALKAANVAPGKIILGFPTYGRAVTGVNGNANPSAPSENLNLTFTASYQGDLDAAGCTTTLGQGNTCAGMIQYKTILANNLSAIDVPENGVDNGAYSYNQGMFVSYDDPKSITAKANYVVNNKLAGMMFWALKYDAPAVNDDGSNNQSSLINAVDQVLGIQPRPYTPPAPTGVKLQLTNNDTTSTATITLIVNGQYYGFPTLGASGSGNNDAQWCSASAAGGSCPDSWNLDQIGNATNVQVQVASATGNPVTCPDSFNLSAGYHHIMVNYSNPNDMCSLN